jgi:ABC-2 type transport system ATP-binding protein
MNPPIVMRQVGKRFGTKTVLDTCDFELRAGSVTGLLGVNGAGKTTLLRTALGLARPDTGTATVFGEHAWNLSAGAKARIGYVPQTPGLVGWLSVRDHLAYVGAFQPRWDAAFAEDLRGKWDLPPDARCAKLSPGEAQRMALVLALAHRPELLVLDEPAASLDPIARKQFMAAVVEVAAAGTTILLSTHLCADLERVADRVAVLQRGRIVRDAGIDELKERVKRVRVAVEVPLPKDLGLSGILSRRDLDGGCVLMVDGDPEAYAKTSARLAQAGATVAVDELGLEEIATELLQ